MRGRKPTPTKLKILHGNPGKRKLGREPEPPIEVPECPPHLDEEARREWAYITPQLVAQKLLSGLDRAALAAYCTTYSRWANAEEVIRKTGAICKAKGGEMFYQNPYLAVANKALKQMREFLTEFGLTPSSRVRLGVVTNDPEDERDRYFFGGGG